MGSNSLSTRVLVLAPTRKDAEVTEALLRKADLQVSICKDLKQLGAEIELGAGTALATEELLAGDEITPLLSVTSNQPGWSEFPLVILMKGDAESSDVMQKLRSLGNVTLLERPAPVRSVISAVKAAIRGRERQYQIRDLLTSERLARTEAEKAGKMKDEFLAVLSHELRTPLNAILGWLQLMRRDKDIPVRVHEGLDIIDRSARLQAKLIADLLDMSRITSGKVHLELRNIDINSVSAAAVDSISPAAQEKKIIVEKRFGNIPVIKGDFDRLQQILWNLLSNAIKFTPTNGHVVLETGSTDSEVFVRVKDNGAGIAPEFIPYVFDRFCQADSSIGRRHGGLGLGLTIAKQLTQLHGGKIAVESNGESQGSSFTVYFPSLSSKDQVDDHTYLEPAISALPYQINGVRVLVVDDDDDSRTLVERFLLAWGAEVGTASSGRMALAMLNNSSYDVIVSDIGMPNMDGYDFMRRVRLLDGKVAYTPAAALTAFARQEERNQALNAGYNSHMPKPIEESMLVSEVARLAAEAGFKAAASG